MSTIALHEPELPIAADDFNALEQRVLRMVELVKSEREARAVAEQRAESQEQRAVSAEQRLAESEKRGSELVENVLTLELQVEEMTKQGTEAAAQIHALEGERETVRGRVERMLKHLDEFTA